MFVRFTSRFAARCGVLLICVLAWASMLAPPAHAAGWPWPVDGEVITPYKNGSDPYAAGQHRGIDIAAPTGTAARAAEGGVVTYAGRLPDSGLAATVRGGDGVHLTSYLHLSQLSVARGQRVSAGDRIGDVGVTGKRSAVQPHLHFSVRLAASGAYVDPLPLLGAPGAPKSPAAPTEPVALPRQQAAPTASARARQQRSANRAIPIDGRSHAAPVHNVHAPAVGDSVAAGSSVPARDSVRESHAPKGRVAPPPLRQPQLRGERLASPHAVETVRPREISREVRSGGTPTRVRFALVLLAGACLIVLLKRRRPETAPADEPPQHAASPTQAARGSTVVRMRASK